MYWKLNLAGGQRLIMNMKNFDVCPLLNNMHLTPDLLKHNIDFMNETFPGMIHKCPYTASFEIVDANDVSKAFFLQSIECVNASRLMKTGEIKAQWYPSGTYKVLYKASDDYDENIFSLVLRTEVNWRLHDTEF
jgi:hypothetical protein